MNIDIGHLSDFQWDEVFGTGAIAVGREVCRLHTPLTWRKRIVYGYINCLQNAAATYTTAQATLTFMKADSPIQKLPLTCAIVPAGDTTIKKSLPSVFQAGGVVSPGTVSIALASPFSGEPANVLLQPFPLCGEFDKILVSLDAVANITNLRIWVGCLSSKE